MKKLKPTAIAAAAGVEPVVIEHSTRAHAILSASSSDRWLICTPSARLNEAAPERGDKTAANKGTLCHELTESYLRKYLGLISASDHSENADQIFANPLWDAEMAEAVLKALDYGVARITAAREQYGVENVLIRLEERVDFSRWVPNGFGSADLVIVTPDYIEVIDWKFGVGKVHAKDNTQMRLYGAGTSDMYAMLYGSPLVKMAIVQPFLDAVETDEISTKELIQWMRDYVKPRALLAWRGEGEFAPGDVCKWCKVRGECKARAEQQLAVAGEAYKAPALLTDEELVSIFLRLKGLRSWANDIEELVQREVVTDKKPLPGLKVIEGKSNRFISDVALAKQRLLEAGFSEDDIAEPLPTERKLLGITAIEKTVGKKAFASVLEGIVVKPQGKPEVVSIDDPREAMQVSSTTPEEDFQ